MRVYFEAETLEGPLLHTAHVMPWFPDFVYKSNHISKVQRTVLFLIIEMFVDYDIK